MRREVIEIVTGAEAIDGAGVHVVRVLGPNQVRRFDPFLMLDAFDSHNPGDYTQGFPFHPHRGIETVTYLIKGTINHQDSLGNKGTIKSGESQWMTAGSGILHQEMPQATEHLLGLQLWINLPKEKKMIPPEYLHITADMIKKVIEPNAIIRVISGDYKGNSGVKGNHMDILMLDIQVSPGKGFSLKTDPKANVFAYIVEGKGHFRSKDARSISNKVAVLFSKEEDLYVEAGDEGIRFILFGGYPLNEPIAWGGPIVMNTRKDIEEAFAEIGNNTFIKHTPNS